MEILVKVIVGVLSHQLDINDFAGLKIKNFIYFISPASSLIFIQPD